MSSSEQICSRRRCFGRRISRKRGAFKKAVIGKEWFGKEMLGEPLPTVVFRKAMTKDHMAVVVKGQVIGRDMLGKEEHTFGRKMLERGC